MNIPALILLVSITAGCDASTPPDSEDDARMLQSDERDQIISRSSSNGFARQDPGTTDNAREELGHDMNVGAGNAAAQPDQHDLNELAGRRQLLV
jgi:hypothetical protein